MRTRNACALLLLVAACSSTAGTSDGWPHQNCPGTNINPGDLLKRIEAKADGAKTYQADVLAAIQYCRNRHHGARGFDYGAHCNYVIRASVFAFMERPNWSMCASLLRHEEPRTQRVGATRTNAEWQATPTAYGMVRNVLSAIIELSPDSDVDTYAGRCRNKDYPYDDNTSLRVHVLKVEQAYVYALGGNWDQCSAELDHMVGTLLGAKR